MSGVKGRSGRPRVLTDEQRLANKKALSHAQYLRKKALETEADREARRIRDRARPKKKRTAEQKARGAELMRKYREAWTPERKAAEKEAKREFQKHYTLSAEQKKRARAAQRAWVKRNFERLKKCRQERLSQDPTPSRIYAQNRRARKRAQAGAISVNISTILFSAQRGRCACCRCDIGATKYELDHIVPLAAGGAHDDANLQLLCMPCNRSKGARDPIVFMQERGFLL